MTNFKGSAFDIVFMQDYTDRNQNRFLEKLVRTYLPDIEISHDRCGYACSDHASWNRAGYPASLPFEAKFDDYNSAIHTEHDTIDQSDGEVRHAMNFLRLSIAYAMEMAKHTSSSL